MVRTNTLTPTERHNLRSTMRHVSLQTSTRTGIPQAFHIPWTSSKKRILDSTDVNRQTRLWGALRTKPNGDRTWRLFQNHLHSRGRLSRLPGQTFGRLDWPFSHFFAIHLLDRMEKRMVQISLDPAFIRVLYSNWEHHFIVRNQWHFRPIKSLNLSSVF